MKKKLDPGTRFVYQMAVYMADDLHRMALARTQVVPYGPDDKRAWDWMRTSGPGDLVVEASSLGLHPERIGRILFVENLTYGKKYTLVNPDGDLMTWENCSFHRVPDPSKWPKGGHIPLGRD